MAIVLDGEIMLYSSIRITSGVKFFIGTIVLDKWLFIEV